MRTPVTHLHLSRARGAIALATVALAALTACSGSGPFSRGPNSGETDVIALFSDASPLVVGNDVKVDGVVVGKIQSMPVRDHVAQVTLRLEKIALPMHKDARATVKPVSLLGERYVDLDRGTAGAPLLNAGDVIPVQQTGQAVDLDQVLDTVDQPTGKALAAFVTLLGHGLQNNGANVDNMINVLESSMRDTGELARVLSQQNKLLMSVADHFEPVASAMATNEGQAMDHLVAATDSVLTTTAGNQRDLDAALAELPGTLDEARQTLGELAGTATATTPVLREIRPTTDNLVALGDEMRAFSEVADPALASTRPVLDRADHLLEEARPVAEELRRAGPDLRGTVHSAQPIVKDLRGNIGNVLNFIRGWAMSTNGWDGLSHYFRGMAIIDSDEVTGLLSRAKNPLDHPTGVIRQLPSNPAGAGLLNGPGLLEKPSTQSSDGGVTGLNRSQESGAVQSLLGGS
jgi:phospholipid/cholesterol/gamma-HCH transport system substrate-binding protein